MTSRILGCVIAYNPDHDFPIRTAQIRSQVGELIVIDNSESSSLSAEAAPGALIIQNRNRGGIAGALNAGLRHAASNGFSHIVFFDHDSTAPDHMVSTLVQHLDAHGGTLAGPIYKNSSTGGAGRFVLDINGQPKSQWIADDKGFLPAFFVITSGTVINVAKLPEGIWYDEELLVDMVDVEFCLQVRAAGGKIFLDTSQRMAHGIGNRPAGSSRFSPPNYSGARHTMIIRNRVILWRRWRKRYPRYVLMDLSVATLDFFRNTLLLKRRLPYLKAFAAGVAQGVSFKLR